MFPALSRPFYAVGTHREIGHGSLVTSHPWGSPCPATTAGCHMPKPLSIAQGGGKHPSFGHRERLGHPSKELNDGLDQVAPGAVGCDRCPSESHVGLHRRKSLSAHLTAHRDLVRLNIWQGGFLMWFLNSDGPTAGKDWWVLTDAWS